MEQIAQFRKWAEEQQKKRKIKVLLGRIETGGIIQLGNYPQDNEGKLMTPIEWIVLERQGDEFLLISKYALDCQPYNTEKKEVTWETCSLRRWLNGVFYEAAFSEKEKEMIMDTELANKDNPKYGTKGGNPTTDRVFLLSIEDAEKYFGSDEERKCVPTKLARTKSIVEYERWYEGYKGTNKKDFLTPNSYAERLKTACWWWLRSPGLGSDDAADVGSGGSLRFNGYWVSNSSDAVRPSLRLHL